jgi:tetratricopeptide (TPR) repeat protein
MTLANRLPLFVIFVCMLVFSPGWGQTKQASSAQDYVPPELQASDPQVKAYLEAVDESAKEGNYSDAFQQLQKALDHCTKKGFLADRALVEARLGTSYFVRGQIEDSKAKFLSAFADSVKTGNLVLQADTLVALSSMAQTSGNMSEAIDLATRALDLARRSRNLFIQSRVLGELGRLQLTVGKLVEARASVQEALRIDRLNQYKWEASHLLYLAWITYGDASGIDQAIQLASLARDLAIKYEDYMSFMQASMSLGRAYVQKGRLADGIAIMERSRDGLSEDGKSLFPRPASYRAAMSLPYLRIAFLEAMALAYQAGRRPDDGIKSWTELYEIAKTAKFNMAAAEAAHGIADLYQTKKAFAKSISYYSLAADGWAKVGNTARRIDALTSEAFMMSQQGEADKAIQVYVDVLPIIKATNNPSRQFLVDLAIAEIAQPRGDLDRTANVLQEAELLLSPDLTLADMEPRFIFGMYLHLAEMHLSKHEVLPHIIALEKAMNPANALGKVEARAAIAVEVNKTLEGMHAQDTANKAYAAGDLATALVYFELIEHIEQTHAMWNGKEGEYIKDLENPALKMVLNLPAKIVDQTNGATILEANLQKMGPIAQMARFPILTALSDHYMAQGRPDMVVKFSTLALPQLKLGEQDQPEVWDVQLSCKLALALLLQKDVNSAVQRIGPCLRSAKKFGNLDLLAMAHQTNVWILQAAGRQSESQESIAFLTQHLPDDPMHFVELAQLRTQQGDELEGIKAWRQALKLLEARGDPNRTAWAHLALGNFLGLATTKNDEEERNHLEAALLLYQRLDDADGAGRANTYLGRYFIRKNDSVRALGFFDMALKLLRRAKNQSFEAYTLSEIGNTYRSTGDSAKALDFYRQAGELYHTVNDLANEAFQLRYQAWALDDLHKPEDTFETTLRAKRVADASGAWSPRYWVRSYLAALYGRRGEYQSSIVALREARAISIAADQLLAPAWADLALAAYLVTVGEREEAVNALNQALPIFQQSKDFESEGNTYSEFMEIYGARESELRDFDKALLYYQSARRLAETHDPARAVSLNLDAVEVYWQQKRYKEAAVLGKEALEYYESKKDEWGQASALLSLAEIQRSAEEVQAAAASMKRAEPLIKRIGDFYMTGRFYYGEANQKKKEGNLPEAIKRYESVVGMLEQFKSTANPALRRKVSDTYGYIYDELIDAWYQLSAHEPQSKPVFADRALEQAELNKSRVFTTAWGRTFLDALRRRLPASLQERERTLTASQDALQLEMEQSISGQGLRPVKQVQENLKRLDGELAALKKDLGQASPAYAEVRYPRAVAIADLPVRAGETFIEFKMLEDSLLVWIITGQPAGPPQLAAFYKVAHPRVWFQERVLGIRSAFNRGYPDQFDAKVSEELFNAIFPEPYTQHLTSAQSVIIVPDDILFLLPFELLSPQASRSQFILLKTPTSYFPSAGALRLSRAIVPAKREWPAQFFGLADPITTSDDEQLRHRQHHLCGRIVGHATSGYQPFSEWRPTANQHRFASG